MPTITTQVTIDELTYTLAQHIRKLSFQDQNTIMTELAEGCWNYELEHQSEITRRLSEAVASGINYRHELNTHYGGNVKYQYEKAQKRLNTIYQANSEALYERAQAALAKKTT